MENINLTNKVLAFIVITVLIVGLKVLFHQQSSSLGLLGKYTNTEDVNWVWDFRSDGKLYEYYEGDLSEVYFFSLETTSPQCGYVVDEGPLFEYLVRENINDPSDKYCYEINSLENDYLQIRYFGTSSFINFKKIE